MQASPSSQLPAAAALTQPLFGSQLSAVQTLLSSQSIALPGAQAPLAQASAEVQASPSSQPALLALLTQPLFGSQLSSVQGLLSPQSFVVPETH